MMKPKELFTTSTVARLLECGTDNVRRLVRTGQLRVAMVVGRGQRLYDPSDVETVRCSRKSAAERQMPLSSENRGKAAE